MWEPHALSYQEGLVSSIDNQALFGKMHEQTSDRIVSPPKQSEGLGFTVPATSLPPRVHSPYTSLLLSGK